MHFSRILIALASVLGIGTAYLPWKSETLLGVTTKTAGMDTSLLLTDMQLGDGWIAAVCFGLVIILVIVGKRQLPVGIGKKAAIVVLAAVVIFTVVYDISQMKNLSVNLPGSLLSTEVTPGLGLYFCGAVALFIELLAIVGKATKQPVASTSLRQNEI